MKESPFDDYWQPFLGGQGFDRQRTAWTEVDLEIDDDQRIASPQRLSWICHAITPRGCAPRTPRHARVGSLDARSPLSELEGISDLVPICQRSAFCALGPSARDGVLLPQ